MADASGLPSAAMRWSNAFVPTLRDDPAGAEAVSHRLLVRGGFVRQLAAGHYSVLPFGRRVYNKIDRIIREEMDGIGGQQFHLPALHPADIWRRSGRWEVMGEEMFRLVDRKGADNCLGMTHEEVFAVLASELSSYRDLPQIWYQVQTKFRDEPRPKSGVLRVREFTMKDSYSLDIDQAGLDAAFDRHHEAYRRIFARCGLDAVDVQASSGFMGGTESIEFMVASPAGEDWIITCESCEYRANLERATSRLDPVVDPDEVPGPERFATPGLRTIAALADAHPDLAAPDRQIKTLVYVLDGAPTLVLLRGDHDLQDQKLVDATGAVAVRPAAADEIRELLGADPGSLGAVGVDGVPVIADLALEGRRGMVTGANDDDWHLQHVDVARDIAPDRFVDLREVGEGEACPVDGGSLDRWKGIEVGHIFKLGTTFSEALDAFVLDEQGEQRPVIMGSYGIGLERTMAAIVEWSHDDAGIVWPLSVAPYHVVITAIRYDDERVSGAVDEIERELTAEGVEVIVDDRAERPGVKFADAELVGIPYRITVGPKGVDQGSVELTTRRGMTSEEVPLSDVVETLASRIRAELRTGQSPILSDPE
jgi:prolyl-tRNA synthetase family II